MFEIVQQSIFGHVRCASYGRLCRSLELFPSEGFHQLFRWLDSEDLGRRFSVRPFVSSRLVTPPFASFQGSIVRLRPWKSRWRRSLGAVLVECLRCLYCRWESLRFRFEHQQIRSVGRTNGRAEETNEINAYRVQSSSSDHSRRWRSRQCHVIEIISESSKETESEKRSRGAGSERSGIQQIR